MDDEYKIAHWALFKEGLVPETSEVIIMKWEGGVAY